MKRFSLRLQSRLLVYCVAWNVIARITEVSNGNCHFCAGVFHGQAPLVEEGFRQPNLEPLGWGPVAVLTAHVQLAKVRMVEAGIQQVETVSVAVGGKADRIPVKTIQR